MIERTLAALVAAVALAAAAAVSVVAAFAHQLMRTDGRPRVVASLSGSLLALGVLASGACWVAAAPDGDLALLPRLAARAALGGALFVLSDALLAINRFREPLPLSGLWILASYWAAQWCIASSLPPRRAA